MEKKSKTEDAEEKYHSFVQMRSAEHKLLYYIPMYAELFDLDSEDVLEELIARLREKMKEKSNGKKEERD